MKSIYDYGDHKNFLKDWFAERKSSVSGFSYEKFSAMAGLGSPNYMKLVIEGRRNLTVANIHLVAEALDLNFDETQFFEVLTLLSQSKGEAELAYYKKRAKELRQLKPKKGFSLKSTDLIAAWYFPAIVVCLDGCEVKQAAQMIVKKTKLNLPQVHQVIELMRKSRLLSEAEGKYKVEFSHFVAQDKKATSEQNKKFLADQLKISQAVFDKNYTKGPKFFAHTFTVGKNSFSTYAEKIHAFIESLTAESNSEPADEILQLNIQFFNILDRS